MFNREIGANETYFLRMTRWCCAVAILSLFGCTGDSGSSDFSRKITDTPLVSELSVTTTDPTRISLDISDGTNSWTIDFTDYATIHTLPILGLRPNRTHNITVHATNLAGEPVTVDQPQSIKTPALPAGFPTIKVVSDPNLMEPGYTLFNVIPQRTSTQLDAMLIMVDHKGEVVWYHRGLGGVRFDDFRQLPNGNIIFMDGWKIVEIDMLGNRIQEWTGITDPTTKLASPEINKFHHELYPMEMDGIANGNFLTLSVEERIMTNYPIDMANYPISDTSVTETARVIGDVIVEFDPSNGELVNKWHLFDMLDPYRLGYFSLGDHWDITFPGQTTRDWSHANAVIYDKTDDSIIVSVRHQDALMKFNRTTTGSTTSGDIKWILAPDMNWDTDKFGPYLLAPVDAQLGMPHFYPYHQHAPMLLPNGNILLYDNGNYRLSPPGANLDPTAPLETFSRAVEYHIDENTMTAELVWQYGPELNTDPAWNYSGALGDANLLPNKGNVLITHGSMAVDHKDNVGTYVKQWARVVEVTRHITVPPELPVETETEVFNMVVEDSDTTQATGWRIYRSLRIENLYPKNLLSE